MDRILDNDSFSNFQHKMNTLITIEECRREGEQQALKKWYKQYYYDYYGDKEDLLLTAIPTHQKDHFKKWHSSRSGSRFRFVFVTVSPYTNVRFKDFYKRVLKSLKKKWIVSSISCLEWTENEDNTEDIWYNGGLHFHTRLELDGKDPYRVKREFYNTFKHHCEPQCIQTRYSNREDSFIEYIKGYQDGKKKDCYEVSEKYRKKYDLPSTF